MCLSIAPTDKSIPVLQKVLLCSMTVHQHPRSGRDQSGSLFSVQTFSPPHCTSCMGFLRVLFFIYCEPCLRAANTRMYIIQSTEIIISALPHYYVQCSISAFENKYMTGS